MPSPRGPVLLSFGQQSCGYIQVKCRICTHLCNLLVLKYWLYYYTDKKKKKKHASLFMVCVVPSDLKYLGGQENYKRQRD